jgi:hypothetical protein
MPALAAWLVFGIALTAWVANATLDRYGGAAADLAVHVTGRSAPADMPADFPIYPGGQIVEAFTTPAAPGTEGVLIETSDSEAAVFAYYNSALQRYPWQINLSVAYPIHEISCGHLTTPRLTCSMVVQRSGDTTQVTFEWVPLRATRR